MNGHAISQRIMTSHRFLMTSISSIRIHCLFSFSRGGRPVPLCPLGQQAAKFKSSPRRPFNLLTNTQHSIRHQPIRPSHHKHQKNKKANIFFVSSHLHPKGFFKSPRGLPCKNRAIPLSISKVSEPITPNSQTTADNRRQPTEWIRTICHRFV